MGQGDNWSRGRVTGAVCPAGSERREGGWGSGGGVAGRMSLSAQNSNQY